VKIDAGRFAGGPISEVRSALGEYAAESLNANEDHLANAEFRLALTRELVSRAVLAAAENARERMRALQ
jgi:CO/xanthine dehydrogenase FAD-binding subunit